LTVFAPTGASVRITSEHARYRQVIREVILTVDLEITLEASAEAAGPPPEAAMDRPPVMKPPGQAMTPEAPTVDEDGTLRPMFESE
jgi:hypothetical protein